MMGCHIMQCIINTIICLCTCSKKVAWLQEPRMKIGMALLPSVPVIHWVFLWWSRVGMKMYSPLLSPTPLKLKTCSPETRSSFRDSSHVSDPQGLSECREHPCSRSYAFLCSLYLVTAWGWNMKAWLYYFQAGHVDVQYFLQRSLPSWWFCITVQLPPLENSAIPSPSFHRCYP